jgi:ABC-type Na+ efflux pump permease subunit
MTVLGAFYPAVDLTAGERERRTEDTTLLLPVPRLAVHQGKILAVCAAALIATALNLLAIGLSAGHLLSLARLGDGAQVELPLAPLVALAPLAALFALFVSAVLTGVASFARTFQEGQALLGPVQLAFIAPAMAGAVPGIESSIGFAFVPVLNVVLAFRGLLLGQSQPLFYALTALALCAYAALATWIALRALSRERVPGGALLRRFLERRAHPLRPS